MVGEIKDGWINERWMEGWLEKLRMEGEMRDGWKDN